MTAVQVPHPTVAALSQSMTASGQKFHVRIRWYRRMRFQRCHRFTVEFRCDGKGTASEPVQLRLTVPGALVVPAEQWAVPRNAARASFSVTPLALGSLADARLDILHQGAVLQENRVPSRSTRQRLTWFLFFAALLAPLGLHWLSEHAGLTRASTAGRSGQEGPLERILVRFVPGELDLVGTRIGIAAGRDRAAAAMQDACDVVLQERANVGFYLMVILLAFAGISLVLHRRAGASLKSKPIMVPLTTGQDSEALSFTSRV